MAQYLVLKSDGESDDQDLGLTSDSLSSGGVLGGDNYTAAETVSGLTAAGGLTSLSSSEFVGVDALVNKQQFVTVELTPLGSVSVAASAGTVLLSVSPQQPLASALSESGVIPSTASLSVIDGTTIGSVNSDVTRTQADTSTIGGVPTATATPLGTTTISSADPQLTDTKVEIFSVVSPTQTAVDALVGGAGTSGTAVALATNVVAVPVSPTLSLVVAVPKGDIGLESAFADSLAASVGANTTIKVAKTIGSTDTAKSALNTTAQSVGDYTATTSVDVGAVSDTQSLAEASGTSSAFDTLGTSSTSTQSDSTRALSTADVLSADGQSTAVVRAAVRAAVLSELDASATTQATPETLSAAAQTLTQQGVVSTDAAAAALVAETVANSQRGLADTATTVSAAVNSMDVTRLAGRPKIGVVVDTVATTFGISPLDALLTLFYWSFVGANSVIVQSEQHISIQNAENNIRVLQS